MKLSVDFVFFSCGSGDLGLSCDMDDLSWARSEGAPTYIDATLVAVGGFDATTLKPKPQTLNPMSGLWAWRYMFDTRGCGGDHKHRRDFNPGNLSPEHGIPNLNKLNAYIFPKLNPTYVQTQLCSSFCGRIF